MNVPPPANVCDATVIAPCGTLKFVGIVQTTVSVFANATGDVNVTVVFPAVPTTEFAPSVMLADASVAAVTERFTKLVEAVAPTVKPPISRAFTRAFAPGAVNAYDVLTFKPETINVPLTAHAPSVPKTIEASWLVPYVTA